MRIGLILFCSLAVTVCGHAQFHHYPESEAVQRWDSSTKKAMAAINEYAEGKPGKKKGKPDPSLANPLGSKTFEGGGGLDVKKKSSMENAFLYDQEITEEKYRGTRKFLGINNPWFGKKVYEAKEASLWSKSVVPNANREFSTESVETPSAYQADKAMITGPEVVRTRPFLGQGGAQGSMNKITESMKKEMSIEEVRELLNKNR